MIMDAFVAMRRFLSANAGMFQRIERLEQHQILTDQKVEQVLQRMDELAPAVTPEQIFATGCVWDAWSYVSQLVRSAKQRIVLIDNFVDERVLTLLTKREKGYRLRYTLAIPNSSSWIWRNTMSNVSQWYSSNYLTNPMTVS